jgi:hypothetical protein
MRRCVETLHCSRVRYKNLKFNEHLRERIWGPGSHKLLESKENEDIDTFYARCDEFSRDFTKILAEISPRDDGVLYRILIVGHGLFYWAWRGKTDVEGALRNAEVVRIDL